MDNTDIFTVGPDGTGLRNLTDTEAAESSVAWSPDGTKLAFERRSYEDGELSAGIFTMNADGTDLQEILRCREERCEFLDLAWSPAGNRIALIERSGGGSPRDRVVVMDADGTDRRTICVFPDCGQAPRGPAWSPDGSRLVFSDQGALGFRMLGIFPSAIYTAEADGSGLTKLSNPDCHIGHDPVGSCPFFDSAPAWSPDGEWIAFSRHLAGSPNQEAPLPGFAPGDTQLNLIRPDGTGLRTVATCTLNYYCAQVMRPAWSPDGTQIAFAPAYEKSTGIRVVEVGSGDDRTLRTCPDGGCLDPDHLTWSPDGERLAFLGGERVLSLYTIGGTGGGLRLVASEVDGHSLAWLPGGRSSEAPPSAPPTGTPGASSGPVTPGLIAFAHYDDDNEDAVDILTVRSDGSGINKLTDNPHFDGEPSWSPDGQRIAFASYRDEAPKRIFVMNADGSDQRAIPIAGAGQVNEPAWSPDGTMLAFVGDGPKGVAAIFVANVDGSSLRAVSRGVSGDVHPAWSPDGTWIMFDHYDRDGSDLYLVHPDGTGARPLIHLPGSESDASWSPDGSQVVFLWFTSGGDDLYVIGADGNGLRRLTNMDVGITGTAWSPDGGRIAFSYGDTAFLGGISAVGADGTGLVNVVAGQGGYSDLAWQPRA